MSHRAWWLVIAAIVLLGIAVAVQEGLRRGADDAGSAQSSGAATATSSASNGPGDAAANPEARAAYAAAMTDAVSTLHTYLAALFKDDRSEADALWIHGRPATQGEADLRTLDGVTGLRVDNDQPQQLDASPVPTTVRIPVRLRIGGQGPLRRYTGHYELRRDGAGWRITAASIDPSPAQR